MAGKHRFKTSRGETFCTYCGSDGTFSLRNECSYYAQKSPHNFVKMKPAEYRKYTAKWLMVDLCEWTFEGYIKMMKKKFNVLIEHAGPIKTYQGEYFHMHANRKGDIKTACKWSGHWKDFEEVTGGGGYDIISNPISYEIKCNRCLRDQYTSFGCS